MTSEIAIKRNTSQEELGMRLWLGATRGQGWRHIRAVGNGMAWVNVEAEC